MEKQRQIKMLSIVALVLAISAMTLGFAAFSTTLNISSSASVTPSSGDFAVKFSTKKDSLLVAAVSPSSKSEGVIATNGTIVNGLTPILTNLSATFTEPGQYVEYIVYARNEGEYTAYLNNINFVRSKSCVCVSGTSSSLVKSACDSINITATIDGISYNETTPIKKHTLESNEGEEVKIKLEYASSGTYVDGPFNITFPELALVYSTIDDSSIQPTLPTIRLVSGDLDTIGSEVCIKEECFNIISSDENTVTMLAKYKLNIIQEVPSQTTDGDGHKIYTEFSNDDQKGENYSDYNGSIVEQYVNAYNSYLITQGITPIETRLITKEELTMLGCSTWSCDGASSFLNSSLDFWTSTVKSSTGVWIFYNMLVLSVRNYDSMATVRPVITISKSEF